MSAELTFAPSPWRIRATKHSGRLMLDSNRLYNSIGERFREVRESQSPRMSQSGLADILGLKRTSVTNIELGNQKPTLEVVYRFCLYFGLELDALLPPVAEVKQQSFDEARSVKVGGKSQEVGAKTASVLDRLRARTQSRS